MQAEPDNVAYRRQAARSYYNRGILLAGTPEASDRAEADFRSAIELLSPQADADAASAQELARAVNNLAGMLTLQPARLEEARTLYERAIEIDERLVRESPDNREYKLELAKFCNNLASLLREMGQPDVAAARSRRAVELIDELARLAPSLAVEQADARTLRGGILRDQDPAAAERDYAEALALFEEGLGDERVLRLPEFHQRFGDLLLDLAAFPARRPESERVRRLLERGVARCADVARAVAARGSAADAQAAAETVSRLLAALPATERDRLGPVLEQLGRRLEAHR